MADSGGEKLFKSYKISVANDDNSSASKQKEDGELEEELSESDDESSSDSSSSGSNSSSSESEEEGELSDDDDDVEVKVVVGPEAEVDALDTRSSRANTLSKRKNFSSSDFTKKGLDEQNVNRFDDQDIDFGDDFDEIMKEVSNNEPICKKDLQLLLKSLDLTESDFFRGGWRPEAICVKGIEKLTTKDIFHYFNGYSPHSIEWINKNTCNIIWPDKLGPVKALIGLSCPIKPLPKVASIVHSSNQKSARVMTSKENEGRRQKLQKKTKGSNDSSSNTSSDSDSDDSDDSSSDSDSSSSDSDSSSSSDSSNSDSDDEKSRRGNTQIEKKAASAEPMEDTVALPPNFHAAKSKNDHSESGRTNELTAMEDEEADPSQGTITWVDIGVASPGGRWRLGVPCANAKAILMRFAHCKEVKDVSMMKKPLETYNQVYGISTRRPLSERMGHNKPASSPIKYQSSNKFRPPARFQESHNRFVPAEFRLFPNLEEPRNDRNSHKFPRENNRPPSRAFGDRPPSGRGVLPPRGGEGGGAAGYLRYQDLDNPFGDNKSPFDDNKNPWGFLAQNWSNKATQESLDYHSLLVEHMTGERKRKRSPMHSDLDSDGTEHSRKQDRRRSNKRSRRMKDDDSNDSGTDNSMEWKRKNKLPRMRMYADSEEKKKKKISKRSSLRNRIGLDEKWENNVENVLHGGRNRMVMDMGSPPPIRRRQGNFPPKRTIRQARRNFAHSNVRSRIQDRRDNMR